MQSLTACGARLGSAGYIRGVRESVRRIWEGNNPGLSQYQNSPPQSPASCNRLRWPVTFGCSSLERLTVNRWSSLGSNAAQCAPAGMVKPDVELWQSPAAALRCQRALAGYVD